MRPLSKSVIAAVLCALVALVGVPALRGTWVYDDNLMVDNPLMDEPSDLLDVFSYNSTHYLRRDANADPGDGDYTYRPLTMSTLTAVHAVTPQPLAHHLASLALHLTAVLLLGLALARRGLDWQFAALGAAAFGVHPAAGEAWLWINGRSDLVAGVFVAAVAALVAGPLPRGPRLASFFALFTLLLVGGTLSKETFLPAAGAVVGIRILAPGADSARSRVQTGALALAGAAIAAVALFALRGATAGGIRAVPTEMDLSTLVGRTPALVALGVETAVLPLPRAMRALFFELHTPWTSSRSAALAGVVLLALAALARKRPAALIALLGTALCLLPTAITTDSFWLGFDRYLYMPLLLAVLAVAYSVAPPDSASAELPPPAPGLPPALNALAAVWLVFAASATWLTAKNYASHAEFELSMLESRPDDPTGYVYVGGTLLNMGRTDEARTLLRSTPQGDWPWLVLYSIEELQRSAGLTNEARATLDTMLRVAPTEPRVRLEAMAWAVRAGDLSGIAEHAAAIEVNDETCELAETWIRGLRGGAGLTDDVRSALDAASARFASCGVDHD
jgi:hypothetical protein